MFFKARKAVRTFLYLFPWFVVFSSFHCFLNWQLFVIHRYLVFQTRIVLDRTGTFLEFMFVYLSIAFVFVVVLPTSHFANNQFIKLLGHFANISGQFTYIYIS